MNSLHYITDTSWLERHLNQPDLRVLDCTVHISVDEADNLSFVSGSSSFDKEHIPGAGFLDLISAASHPDRPGSFVLPSQEQFASALREKGVSNDSRVVLYSASSYQWATRVWWLLRLFGFDNATVLDGGFQKWSSEKRPISAAPSGHARGAFQACFRPELLAEKHDILAAIASDSACVINALSPAMYSGESPLHFGRRGHISGSINLWVREFVDPETNTFLAPSVILRKLEAAGVLDAARHITYCGKGVSATADAFALSMVGLDDVAVYNGSMEEWASDPSLPMTRGLK